MKFEDITQSDQFHYILDQPGKHVFFCFNRSGDFTFELAAPGSEVYVFALFVGKETKQHVLRVTQHHKAPQTTSRLLVKSVLSDQAIFRYEGLIKIDHAAKGSDAEQANRNLLLSKEASAFSKPDLEILTDDVACRHASTTSQLNADHLFFAESRGIPREDAQEMLAEGFIQDMFGEIEKFGNFPELERYKETLFRDLENTSLSL